MVKDKHPQWLKDARIWALHIVLVGLLGLIVWLLWQNRSSFINPPNATNIPELVTAVLSNKANIQVIAIGSFFCLLGLFYVLIKLPFVNWENLKLFGFEMKKASELQIVAKEELSYSNEIDWLRVQTIETISSELGYDIIEQYVTGEDFDGLGAFTSILQEVVDVYRKKLNIFLDFGVLRVVGKEIDQSEASKLPGIVNKTLFCALWTAKPQSLNEDGESVVVSPVLLAGETQPKYLIYLFVKNYVFDKRDEVHIQAIVNVVKTHVDLAVVSNIAKGGTA